MKEYVAKLTRHAKEVREASIVPDDYELTLIALNGWMHPTMRL